MDFFIVYCLWCILNVIFCIEAENARQKGLIKADPILSDYMIFAVYIFLILSGPFFSLPILLVKLKNYIMSLFGR